MTLIVEDGTGKANAEAFCDTSYADTYHSNLGNTAWAALDPATKEAKLRVATNWLTQHYRLRWKGWRSGPTQRLDWPRLGVFIRDVAAYPTGGRLSGWNYMIAANEIPALVKDACCELALLAITDNLTPTLTQTREEFQTGPIKVKYAKGSPQTKRYPHVFAILQPLLNSGGGNVMRTSR